MQPISTIPQDLVFDGDSIESILYGVRGTDALPADVVDMWQQGRCAEATAGALAAVLVTHPDLAGRISRLQEAENLLRAALSVAKEHCDDATAANRLAALANLIQATGRFSEAEELYRQALASQEKALGGDHEDTLRTLGNLAQLLETQGKRKEAGVIRVRCAVAQLCRKGDEESMVQLRTIAYELFCAGEFARAEEIYRRMFQAGFQVASICCHLARVLFLSDREKEARGELSIGWKHRARALPYVPPRILFFQIAFALLDGSDPALYITRLKHLLLQENVHEKWTMEPVISHLRSRLSPDDVLFLEAIVAALNHRGELADLERCVRWKDQPAFPSASQAP